MNPFRVEVPTTRAGALAVLAKHPEEGKLIAGGTGLLNLMKQRLAFPQVLVSLHQVAGMREISLVNGALRVGALARLADLERSPLVHEHWPMLTEALVEVASPRIRAMATVGGALAHGDPHQDTPAALMALGASVVVEAQNAQRELLLDELYVDYYETCLDPRELITELVIPRPSGSAGGKAISAASYVKYLPRSAEDYATVAVAVQLNVDPDSGQCQQCRIVLGSVAATPLVSHAAAAVLEGQALSLQRFVQAGERAATDTDPLSDTRGSAEYKRAMAAVFVRRALVATAKKLGWSGANSPAAESFVGGGP